MRTRALIVAAVVAAALAGIAAVALAATPDTPYSGSSQSNLEPQAGARWGERLVVAGDHTGDGVNDLFMAVPFADLSFANQGRVYLLNGKDRSVIRAIDSPDPQANSAFGFYISSPGDLNGDGKSDVVAGTDAQNVYTGSGAPCGAAEPNGCNEKQGRAWAINGATGAVLYTLDNPFPQGTTANTARFGSRIGSAGDVTADGVSDVIVGASNNDVPAGCAPDVGNAPAGCRKNQGQAFVFNGKTGALIRTLNLPDADQPPTTCTTNCGTYGIAVQGLGDVDKDGITDHQVDAGSYSFYTGSGGACGTPETPVTPNGCNEGQGRVYVISGATGNLIRRFDDPAPQPGAVFGFQDVAPNSPGDVNGDGAADVYANGFSQNGPTGLATEGRAWVFSGATGAVLFALRDPTPEVGGQFGWSMMRTSYNAEGTPDLYVGQSPHHEPGSTSYGGTYIFDGRDGSLLKTLELPTADLQAGATGDVGPALGWGLAAPGDINGDGEPDYVAGAPFYNEGGMQDNGRIYTFLSQQPVGTATPTPTATQGPYEIPTPTATPTATATPTSTPGARRRPGLTATVRPKRDRRRPFRYATRGRLIRPSGVSASAGCRGRVRITVKRKGASKTLSSKLAAVKSSCAFSSRVSFANARRLGGRRGTLRFTIRFQGNARLLPRSITRTARYG